jgi:hypothetical protein
MATDENLSWSALEYEDRERSADWYWALGIIVVTSSIASIIYGNYFFAGLLLLSGVLLGFFAKKKPEMIDYELNKDGFKAGSRLYPYETIKSFWVQKASESREVNPKSILFINSNRSFMPIITIPIEETMAEDINSILLSQNIAEKEMREHPTDKIMEALGF